MRLDLKIPFRARGDLEAIASSRRDPKAPSELARRKDAKKDEFPPDF